MSVADWAMVVFGLSGWAAFALNNRDRRFALDQWTRAEAQLAELRARHSRRPKVLADKRATNAAQNQKLADEVARGIVRPLKEKAA